VIFSYFNIMAAANQGANLFHNAVNRILIYTGDGNDNFTPDPWIRKIRKARNING
jgi:hypothetical protein